MLAFRLLTLEAALTSTLHWFETELLTREEILIGLMALNRATLGQAECLNSSDRVVLDNRHGDCLSKRNCKRASLVRNR